MTKAEIIAARDKIAQRFGSWTAHDIALGEGVSTLDKGLWQQWRVDQFSRLLREAGCDIPGSRILDLACLEGMFAIEFARMGADTVGLEIREAHLARAEFARTTIGLANCRFVQGDVRTIPPELGSFEVILCAGILYHLNFPDCVQFLAQMAERASRFILIDSHFAYPNIDQSVQPLGKMRDWIFEGRHYQGREVIEHATHVTDEEKRTTHVWASIDNNVSVWLSENAVISELQRCGFEIVSRIKGSAVDRPTLLFERAARRG